MAKEPQSVLPGSRAALKPGSLSRPFFGSQGDEHRAPPGAQPNVKSAPTIVPAKNPQNTASPSTQTTEHDKLDGIDHGVTQP
jgi:hypothetical protein